MSNFIREDFEGLQLTDPMATTRSMTADGIVRILGERPGDGPGGGRLVYEVVIPDNASGQDVASSGLNHTQMDLTGIRISEDGRLLHMDYKLHLTVSNELQVTVSNRRKRQIVTERLSCDCGNWSERFPYPCMVSIYLAISLSKFLTDGLQCMYKAQDDLTRATLDLPPADFPKSSKHSIRMGSENKVDVVLTRQRDNQMFRIDGHELVAAQGVDLVVHSIKTRSSESEDERERRRRIVKFLHVLGPVELVSNHPNRPKRSRRAECWNEFSAFFAEYAKRDPSILNNLSQLLNGIPNAILALEKQHEEVKLCFAEFDRSLDYDERVCKRSLEQSAGVIRAICEEDAGQHISDDVSFSATSAIVYMLEEICSRNSHDRNLYRQIMTDQPEEFWNPVLVTLSLVRPLDDGLRRSLGMIHNRVGGGIHYLRHDLLDLFHLVIQG
jgi:hypothetical protein